MIENNINNENEQDSQMIVVKTNNIKRKKITAAVLSAACILAVGSTSAVLSNGRDDSADSADLSDYAYTAEVKSTDSTETETVKASVKSPEIPVVNVPDAKPDTNSNVVSGSSSVKSMDALEYSPALYDVSVKYGLGTEYISASGTVEDALLKAGVDFDDNDIVTPALDTPLSDDLSITVENVTYTKLTTKISVPYETKKVPDDTLYEGETVLVTEGKEGEIHRQYYVKKIDGEEVARKLINEEVITESVNEVYAYGTKTEEEDIPEVMAVSETDESEPVEAVDEETSADNSTAEGNYAGNVSAISTFTVPEDLLLDESGAPINYVRTVTGKSCAYTANAGALMSTGKAVDQGYVAVNPNVIPYGSKLYIVADDGEVYGYAIAADTGGSVMKNSIVVDLFMWSYDDCIQWGAKNVTIYVIEEG